MNSEREREKQAAAAAAAEYVKDGMAVGLGTGSTAAYAVKLLGGRVRQGLRIRGVPTSKRTEEMARAAGIELATLEQCPRLDVTIDGADEANRALELIKGGGGALLREKIVASVSERMIVIADSSKLAGQIGAFPLPVEVVPFAWPVVLPRLKRLGCEPALRRQGDSPFLTDEGNYILDCPFGAIPDPSALAAQISPIPGVVEHGLFIGLCHLLIIGRGDSTESISR